MRQCRVTRLYVSRHVLYTYPKKFDYVLSKNNNAVQSTIDPAEARSHTIKINTETPQYLQYKGHSRE